MQCIITLIYNLVILWRDVYKRQLKGEYVLCITKSDLLAVREKEDFNKLLLRKWCEVEERIADDVRLLG